MQKDGRPVQAKQQVGEAHVVAETKHQDVRPVVVRQRQPVQVMITVDYSWSMMSQLAPRQLAPEHPETRIEEANRIVAELYAELAEGDKLALRYFGKTVETALSLCTIKDAVRAQYGIDRYLRRPSNDAVGNSDFTAFYDAVVATLNPEALGPHLRGIRNVALLITDGMDNASEHEGSRNAAREAALRCLAKPGRAVDVWIIGVGVDDKTHADLEALTAGRGGHVKYHRAADLVTFRDLLNKFKERTLQHVTVTHVTQVETVLDENGDPVPVAQAQRLLASTVPHHGASGSAKGGQGAGQGKGAGRPAAEGGKGKGKGAERAGGKAKGGKGKGKGSL